jgi:uncharacterized heparinase superfamily protein
MKLKRFLESVRHTRPKQLFQRLRLTAKRKLEIRRAKQLRTRLELAPLPSLATQKPRVPVLMPMRKGNLSIDAKGYSFCFLNETKHFSGLDWQPHEASHLWFFNLHYMEYLEEVSNTEFKTLVSDWIDKNPAYGPKYWLGNWNAFVLSIRVVVWLQQYVLREHELDETFKTKLLDSVVRQMRFLKENLELDLCGNHLLKDLKALIWAGRFFATAEAKDWLELGTRLLERELKDQILSDGLHYERSPAYHAQVFVDLLECYQCLDESPFKSELFAKLSLAAQALADTTHPDGQCSQFNDGGLNMAYSPRECLAAWEKLTREQIKARDVFAMDSAGFYGTRKGQDYLLIDCGPIGPNYLPGHGHGDIFAFEWSLDGQRILIDTGVFEYTEGEKRSYARSSKAHNTLTLDGNDQCEFWGAFRVARRAKVKRLNYEVEGNTFKLSGEHDGYSHLAGKPIHRRNFEASAERIWVSDEVIGGTGQKAEARLLLHPECQYKKLEDGILIRRGETRTLLQTSFPISLESTVYFPDFGQELTTTQIVIDYGTAPCVGNFTLSKN